MRETEPKLEVSCGIESALKLLGDKWTLLIVRDVMRGLNRFESIQSSLNISRNVLALRLAELEKANIICKNPIKKGAKRMLYNPTPRCLALIPTLVSLIEWSSEWSDDDGKHWSSVRDKCSGEPVRTQVVSQEGDIVPISQLKISFTID